MNRYLVGIPVLHGIDHTREAIESSIHEQSEVLVIDNGSDDGVKAVINGFADSIEVIKNETNIYVNPAWNQILEYFFKNDEYTHVVLFNSDAVLPPNWPLEFDKFYRYFDWAIPVPREVLDKRFAWQEQDVSRMPSCREIEKGIRGICIVLTKEQARKIYPIPEGIKVWFGDNWIYDILRVLGHNTMLFENVMVYHALSQNVSIVPDAIAQIEKDKEYWHYLGKEDMDEVISKYK